MPEQNHSIRPGPFVYTFCRPIKTFEARIFLISIELNSAMILLNEGILVQVLADSLTVVILDVYKRPLDDRIPNILKK